MMTQRRNRKRHMKVLHGTWLLHDDGSQLYAVDRARQAFEMASTLRRAYLYDDAAAYVDEYAFWEQKAQDRA